MNRHKKFETLKLLIKDYSYKMSMYGEKISTNKVIHDIRDMLQKVE